MDQGSHQRIIRYGLSAGSHCRIFPEIHEMRKLNLFAGSRLIVDSDFCHFGFLLYTQHKFPSAGSHFEVPHVQNF